MDTTYQVEIESKIISRDEVSQEQHRETNKLPIELHSRIASPKHIRDVFNAGPRKMWDVILVISNRRRYAYSNFL